LLSQILRAAGSLYPLYSGCGTIANSRVFRSALAAESSERTIRLKSGALIIVPTDDYVGRSIYYFGDLDRKLTWLCREILRPGDVAIDIGANIGLVSLNMAAFVGPSGRVEAFEPQPRLWPFLRRSIELNSFSQITLHPIALGAEDGTLELSIPLFNSGGASLHHRYDNNDCVEITVRNSGKYLSSLDLPRIRLMKIDVEGYEQVVLSNATSFFVSNPPESILFELNDHSVPFHEQPVVLLLRDLDYELYNIPRSLLRMRLEKIPKSITRASRSHDVLGIRRDIWSGGLEKWS
jgi:FkbM family methyltransferase